MKSLCLLCCFTAAPCLFPVLLFPYAALRTSVVSFPSNSITVPCSSGEVDQRINPAGEKKSDLLLTPDHIPYPAAPINNWAGEGATRHAVGTIHSQYE